MTIITKDDFYEFKHSTVYQELSASFLERISELGAEIVNREHCNNDRDQLLRGLIKGMVEVLEWEPEFVITGNNAEEEEKEQ